MGWLIVKKKTGFKNNEPHKPLIIRDFRYKIFYSTVGLSEIKSFNMPEGKYFLEQGNVTALGTPVNFPLIPMPKPQRKLPFPTNFEILFSENPNKCTISWTGKKIIFDNSLLEKTIPELWFILFHEYGHSLFKDEALADQMAHNLMVKRGFNPSQIGSAPITSLSSFQLERKKNIVKKILHYAKRYK